ncbi:MAG: DUF1538 domain-containing protein [Woeseiaceae bacterium]|nr:DUF1538 domain-containing protein [Woeseiaceae bacterium]
MDLVVNTLLFVADSALDVLPVVAFLFAFQWFVIGERMRNVGRIITGFLFVVVGLGLFLEGLEESLFPLGRMMAEQLTHPEFLLETVDHAVPEFTWDDFYWVYIFAATVGFSTAMAEPSLIAVAMKANTVSGGTISVVGLRVAVATGAGIGVALGCLRVITGLPLPYLIAAGYFVVIVQTIAAPKEIVPLAYDSGGVTTSTVTVPLVAALGLGLADAVPGRSPLIDGFGLIALTAMFPIISVLAYGQLALFRNRVSKSKRSGKNSDEQ